MRRLWLVGLLILSACVPPPRPPDPPKPPKLRTVAIVINGNATTGTATVDDIDGPHTCELVDAYCETVVHDYPVLQQTIIMVQSPGYQPYRADAVTLEPGNVQIWIGPGCGMPDPDKCINLPPLVPTRIDLPRIVAGRAFFTLQDGRPIFVNAVSDFSLFSRFLAGEDIRPRLRSTDRFKTSENVVVHRVWMMADTGFSDGSQLHFHPQDYPNYFIQLHAFAQVLAQMGHYAVLTLFVNTGRIMPVLADQQTFVDTVAGVMNEEPNLIGSAGNEYDQDANAWFGHDIRWPATLTFSAGSGGSQIWPDDQFGFKHLQFTEYHVFATEWQRKAGHEAMEIANSDGIAVITTEMTRPDQDPTPGRFRGAGAVCKLLAGGCLYHSASGRLSLPIPATEEPFVSAWIEGVNSVPVSCQPGQYLHRQDLETLERPPGLGVLRAYERRTGDPRCIATTPW